MISATRTLAFLIAFGLVPGVCPDAYAQLGVEWVARYDGPVHGWDSPSAIAVDDSGNVYVTGRAEVRVGWGGGMTVKYSPTGDTAWVRLYEGPDPGPSSAEFDALAVDASGNVCVTGVEHNYGSGTSLDIVTVKYSPAGDTCWVRRYDGPGHSWDWVAALAVDDSGYVYVTGESSGSEPYSEDFVTIKYSPAGDTVWVRRYNGPGDATDAAKAIAVDMSRNVYVTGYSEGSDGYYSYATIKYSPAGDTIWVRRYDGTANSQNLATKMAIDGAGNVLVTGFSGSGTAQDYTTIKYSPAGDTLWVGHYEGTWGGLVSFPAGIVIDGTDNVYVVGENIGLSTDYDYVTIKYSSAGDTIWTRPYSGAGAFRDYPTAVATDTSGNVYVAGKGVWVHNTWDYTTIKYSPAGDTLWRRRYNGPTSGSDVATALAVDDSGNAYVTGSSLDGSGADSEEYDIATIKYGNPTGDVNCDGWLDISDVVLLGNIVDGTVDLTGTCGTGQADVDSDGNIDEDDYNLLFDVVAGMGP